MKISHTSLNTDTTSHYSAITAKDEQGTPTQETDPKGIELSTSTISNSTDRVTLSEEALQWRESPRENREIPSALTYSNDATFGITGKNTSTVRPSIEVLEEVRSILDESLAKTESVTSMAAGISQYLKNQGENL